MASIERYTLSYRSKEARQVMEWVQAGQCGSIIGLRGTGKSNFAQFLTRKDVKRQYLGQNSKAFHFISINLLALTKQTDWGVYEILLSNLVAQFRPPDWERTTLNKMSSLHREMLSKRDVVTAQRAFEHCMTLMSQQTTQRLVFIFDEFDDVFRNLPAVLFRCLRAIRDAHKEQISFLFIVTQELAELRNQQMEDVEHFHRLISRNICWLGLYSEADVKEMISYLAVQRSKVLSEGDTAHLLELSGKHAGLLKALLSFIWNNEIKPSSLMNLPDLTNESSVRRECSKIWKSLSDSEQAALFSLVNGEPVPLQTLVHLTTRGLLQKSNSYPTIFSPLFSAFVKRKAPPPQMGFYINRSSHVVQIDGQSINGLTELEFEFLCYLYENRGHLCTKDDIVRNIYRQQYDFRESSLTDQMLQALVSRLRGKFEADRAHPKYLITVRGEGYKFVTPSKGP